MPTYCNIRPIFLVSPLPTSWQNFPPVYCSPTDEDTDKSVAALPAVGESAVARADTLAAALSAVGNGPPCRSILARRI